MRRAIPILSVIVCLIGVVEATAYWWMHPAPAGINQPVLVYRPGGGDERSEIGDPKEADSAHSSSPTSSPSTINSQLSTSPDSQPSTSSITSLPSVVAAAIPSLRCTTGTAARIDRDDGVTIHLAFFEWDLADSTNVLEAFKHLPDECMGSIGMTLIEKRSPRSYQVGSETLSFDHTVFRDPAGVTVHAFKGTWVSGASTLIGDGFRGGVDQWRQIRWKSALKRFRPAHARVAQGAVRGMPNPDFAWEAFETAMLADLKFQ